MLVINLHSMYLCLIGCFLYHFIQMLFKLFGIYESAKTNQHQIIMFNGEYDNFVIFILMNDAKKRYKFSPLTSMYAKTLLYIFSNELYPQEEGHGKHINYASKGIVLLDNDKLYFKSEALLRILAGFSGSDIIWLSYGIFLTIPTFIRDLTYKKKEKRHVN